MNEINFKLHKQLQQVKPAIKAKVISTGSYLPPQRVTSDDIMSEIQTERLYGIPHNWMSDSMGIIERRMVSLETTPSDLAIKAAQDAFESTPDFDTQLIDAVIFCGIERDMPEPATAHIIQNTLGLKAQHVFDVANACCGFFDGLKIASNLIESGAVKYALIVTGEITTKMSRLLIQQLKKGVSPEEAKHMWGMLSVGDAGGAVVVGQSTDGQSGFMKFNQQSESKHFDLCNYQWGHDGTVKAHMNMGQIVARGLKLNKKVYRETLDELEWQGVDWAIAHQTGETAFQHAMNLHGLNENKIIKTYPMLGNITTATLPVSFQKLFKSASVKPKDRIGGLFAGSGLVAGQFGYIV